MASLPSLALSGSSIPKLDDNLRKLSNNPLLFEKDPSNQHHSREPKTNSRTSPEPIDFKQALQLLKEGTEFNSTIYVPLIHQCIKSNCLSSAKAIHSHTIRTGCCSDTYVATAIVNAYTKCGATNHSQLMFDEMSERNVITWTALINGYVRNSDPQNAVQMFIKMLESGWEPVSFTFWAVLNACCDLYNLKLGEQIHAYIIKSGVSSIVAMGGSLSNMYSKCGNLELAIKSFECSEFKDVVTWTAIISACGDSGNPQLGLRMFIDMLHENIWPNRVTLSSVASLFCACQDLQLGPTKQYHAFCIKCGGESVFQVRNSLMYMYLKCGAIEDATRLVENMTSFNLVTINSLIAGLSKMMGSGKDDMDLYSIRVEAFKVFKRLKRSFTKPDMFTFTSVLNVCTGLMALECGTQIHAQMVKSGVLSDIVSSTSLVNMYGKCGNIEDAMKAFSEMQARTVVSWTTMISAYSQNGQYKEAIESFEEMLAAGVNPTLVSFIGVLSACSYACLVDKANYYFNLMKDHYGIEPDTGHYACMADMFVRLGRITDAFEFIERENFEPNEIIWCILIAGCRSHGNTSLAFYAAERLLELKPKKIETYVLLLNMYKSADRWRDVSRVRMMIKEENIPYIRDRSWITIKGKVNFFVASGRSHSENDDIFDLLEDLIEKAKGMGYEPYQARYESDGEEEKKETKETKLVRHHSEKLAVAFGLINVSYGDPIRVLKNISMCKDCHTLLKLISVLTEREIIVRDSKRFHKFKEGVCSCGDFGVST
ncbi:Pentatricopeptide repeat-containing protein [Rhynchospora pubera]|uniref:Pentatricopeptide repeat-containing protein n=1 Tax=Rhynchospora pubera TaxID=906938 RepID=A0AAV8FQ13_9POAL|nr:Pentatricopeptide repeat-containing protein [Rhynchospora pubera]